jgi:hypothetical protein
MSDGAFDAFLDAIKASDAYYLTCPQGHGSVPPQRICSECHSRELSCAELPTTGEIATYAVVSVPAPRFSDQSPYVTAIAEFGPVALTGQMRGVPPEAVEVGQSVTLTVETPATAQRVLVFNPQ